VLFSAIRTARNLSKRSPRLFPLGAWMFSGLRLTLAGGVLSLGILLPANAFPPTARLRSGEWSVWLDTRGPCVAWGGWPLVVGGYVRLYRPQFRGSLLHSFKARRPKATVKPDARGGLIRWRTRHREYRMTYDVRLTPPHVRLDLDVSVDAKAAFGGVEFAAAFLPPSLVAGVSGRRLAAGQWHEFTVPTEPTGNWDVAGRPAKQIVLETHLGKLTITDPNGERLRLSDMRLNPNYRTTAPYFWVFPVVSITPDRRIRGAVDIAFEPAPGLIPLAKIPPTTFSKAAKVRILRAPATNLPRVYPQPRRLVRQPGTVRIPVPVPIRTEGNGKALSEVAGLLAADIERLFGCGVRMATTPAGKVGTEILLGLERDGGRSDNPEAYRLAVGAGGVRITSGGTRGLYYGTQALLQVLQAPAPSVLTVPACRIEDGPDLARRVVHPPRLWPGSSLAYFRRYFDILARSRYNLAVWEISGSVRFPGLPWAWKERGSFEPGPVREVIADARRRGLDMVPELECLGHVNEWLGGDPGDLKRFPWLKACFEDSRRTDLCTSNPRTREVVCRTIDAVSALFDHPPFFHIGLDESWRFATCPVCSKRDPATLLADWLQMLHSRLTERGQTMMMWHDMLLSKKRFKGAVANGDRTEGALDRLPRDTVICNWQYRPGPAFPVTEYFQKKGFNVLICPWYAAADILDCAQAAHRLRSGLFSTNWNAFIIRKPMPAFAVLAGRDMMGSLLTAEYAWRAPAAPDPLLAGLRPLRDLSAAELRGPAGREFLIPDFRKTAAVPQLPLPTGASKEADEILVAAGIPFLPAAFLETDTKRPTVPARIGAARRGLRNIPIGGRISDVYILAAIRTRPTDSFTAFELRLQYRDGGKTTVSFDKAVVEAMPFFRIIGLAFTGKFAGFSGINRYSVLRLPNPTPGKIVEHAEVVQTEGEPVDLIIAGLSARVFSAAEAGGPGRGR